MKLFTLNQIVSFAKVIQIPAYDITELRTANDPLAALKTLLSNRQIINILRRRTPKKSYGDLNIEEKKVADFLFKDNSLVWLRENFGLVTAAGGDDIDKLERLVRDNSLFLPEGLRKEVLESIKRHR